MSFYGSNGPGLFLGGAFTRQLLSQHLSSNHFMDSFRGTQHQFPNVLDTSLLLDIKANANIGDLAGLNSISS